MECFNFIYNKKIKTIQLCDSFICERITVNLRRALALLCIAHIFTTTKSMQTIRKCINQTRMMHARSKHINAQDYKKSLVITKLYAQQSKTEAVFRKDLTSLLKTNFLASRHTRSCYAFYEEAMDKLQEVKAPQAIKRRIVDHLSSTYSGNQAIGLMSGYYSFRLSHTLRDVRFITTDRNSFDRAITSIGKALNVPTHIIDSFDIEPEDFEVQFHTFFQKYSSSLIKTMKKEKSGALLIVVHQKDSAWSSRHLEKMIKMYGEAAGFLCQDFQKILIIQTAPESLKTEKEKEEAKNPPGQWYMENPREITIDSSEFQEK